MLVFQCWLFFIPCLGDDLDFTVYGDVHIPAVLIKTFLRDLPEPLLTFEKYQTVLELAGCSNSEKAPFCYAVVFLLNFCYHWLSCHLSINLCRPWWCRSKKGWTNTWIFRISSITSLWSYVSCCGEIHYMHVKSIQATLI